MYRYIQFKSLAAMSSGNYFEYSCKSMHKLHYFCCFTTAQALCLQTFTVADGPGVTLTSCHIFSTSGTWNLISHVFSFGFAKQYHQDAIALPLPMLHKP